MVVHPEASPGPPPTPLVRAFKDDDVSRIVASFAELQRFEKSLESNRAEPSVIAAAYVDHLLMECRRWDGAIFVAEREGQMAGFICVLAHRSLENMIEAASDCAYVTDLVVSEQFRRQGVARMLLARAEAFAVQRGAAQLRVDVLARNTRARRVYEAAGFRELELGLLKEIGP